MGGQLLCRDERPPLTLFCDRLQVRNTLILRTPTLSGLTRKAAPSASDLHGARFVKGHSALTQAEETSGKAPGVALAV